MSNFALHSRLKRVEMATIYKVGFWAYTIKIVGGFIMGLGRFL